MLPLDLRCGQRWVEGELPANGQLVTKPTLLLKLGHRIEMGTAELSPNRTVAHLVPGLGNTWRGGGRAQEANPAGKAHSTHKAPVDPRLTHLQAFDTAILCRGNFPFLSYHLNHRGKTS